MSGIFACVAAGVRNPRKELSVAEVHDCFYIHYAISIVGNAKGQEKYRGKR